LGADVHVFSRHPHPDFEKEGIRFSAVDVSQPAEAGKAEMPEVLHGLVYCPGSIKLAQFQRLTDDDFMDDFNLHVLGAIRIIRTSLAALQKAQGSSIVLISTVAVHRGMSFHASVSTMKAGLEGLTRALAAEFVRRKIRVNAVAPSLTDTPQAAKLLETEEKRERAAQRHPLGRYGSPTDIANAITFLLSEESSWITGQVLSVDGGLSVI
jgi:NAD(P)-dependent dehydrogenase (short-subunit alcohol dehydrogenase family)